MCRVHSWSRYDLELWPQGQIYKVFDMFLCLAHNYFWFDVGLPYLADVSITMRRCNTFIHVPDSMLTFDFKFKFISKLYFHHGFDSGEMSLLFDIDIPNFSIWVYHHETTLCTFLTLVWPWPLTYMLGGGGILSEFYSVFILFVFIVWLNEHIAFYFICVLVLSINFKLDSARPWYIQTHWLLVTMIGTICMLPWDDIFSDNFHQ